MNDSTKWLDNFKDYYGRIVGKTKARRCRQHRHRPLLEVLEDRTVPSGAGSLDPTFGNGGKVLTDIGAPSNDHAQQVVAYQTDGKAVVVGGSQDDLVVVRYNTDGSVDTTFGTNGKAKIAFAFNGYSNNESVAIDSAGRILVTGTSATYNFAVARLTSSGVLDTSFNGTGIKTINVGGYLAYSQSVAVDSAGHIIVAGDSYQGVTGYDFAVARLTYSGALDTTFNGTGIKTIDFGNSRDGGHSVTIDSKDRIVVAGQSYQGVTGYDFAVARLTYSGALDTSFNGSGKQTIDFGSFSDFGRSVAVDSSDRVVVGGTTGNHFGVARLTEAGALDISFNGSGKQTIKFGRSYFDEGYSVAVDSSNRVLMAGQTYNGGAAGYDFAVARLSDTGGLDGSFNSTGEQTIDFGSYFDHGYSVAVDSAGRILVAGSSAQPTTGGDLAVARLTSDGTLDNSFDGDGKVTTDIGRSTRDVGRDITAYQSDGKMVVVGQSESDMVAVRYNPDGSLDTTFGTDGKARIHLGYSYDLGYSVAVDSVGRILVAGSSYLGDFAVARLTSAGALDTTFNGTGTQIINFVNYRDRGYSVAVDSKDRVLVGGYTSQGTTGFDFAVARLTTTGALDTTFNGTGKQTIDFGNTNDIGYSLTVDSLDRVLVAGQSYQGSFTGDFAVARLTSSGELDTTFNGTGKQLINFGNFASAVGRSVAVDHAGRILVGGSENYTFAVARLTGSGDLDTTFNGTGIQTINVGGFPAYGERVAADSADRVLVGGSAYLPKTGEDFAVARLTNSGTLDTAFNGTGTQTIDLGSYYDAAYSLMVDSADRVVMAGGTFQPATEGDFALVRLLSNSPPTANADSYTTDEDTVVNVGVSGVLTNDMDPDTTDTLTVSAVNGVAGNVGQQVTLSSGALLTVNADGSLTYDPNGQFEYLAVGESATDTFAYTVNDGHGGTDTATVTITITGVNDAPANVAITQIGDGSAVFPIGSVSFAGNFSDVDSSDTHTATWTFTHTVSDTPVSVQVVQDLAQGVYTVNDTIDFNATNLGPGVYTVTLTIDDGNGGVATSLAQIFVIYDPSAGFVSGGGWINSPAGAYAADPTLTGRADFGFISKYEEGQSTPSGETEFNFSVGALDFHSSSYEWLVVCGARAQYKGEGTINESGDFGFILTAVDGQVDGGGGVDKLRMKIWDKSTGNIVYDNQMGDDEGAALTTALGGGSIVINTGNALQAAALPNDSRPADMLTAGQLQPIVQEAIVRWEAISLTAEQVSLLQTLPVHIGNLGGSYLGMQYPDAIWIDDDADGWGWFVDPTPHDDSEFTTPGNQGEMNRMDLVTVVMHEMGHALGYAHTDQGVMLDTLAAGQRHDIDGLPGSPSPLPPQQGVAVFARPGGTDNGPVASQEEVTPAFAPGTRHDDGLDAYFAALADEARSLLNKKK